MRAACRLPITRRNPWHSCFRAWRNFIRNGYFPTDEPTLERALSALAPSPGAMSILDPCAGEGVAIAETAHALGREQVRPSSSSTTPSVPATHGNWSIAASTVT